MHRREVFHLKLKADKEQQISEYALAFVKILSVSEEGITEIDNNESMSQFVNHY